jgi:hypothetical protein
MARNMNEWVSMSQSESDESVPVDEMVSGRGPYGAVQNVG